ncbi:MAG: family acetyltransferase [Paenibacillaceae bacterium]|jgi:RimJ/RimL family protein N-acetyltransferase|nr:family acetyltransferase [Paenibacillaceae bacterium]
MKIDGQSFSVNGMSYTIRSAELRDAAELSAVRLQIDGETEYMDRCRGEGIIAAAGFEQLIQTDSENLRNLFLVAETNQRIVGFARCEGSVLSRLAHKVDFGVCVLREFWGYAIGRELLKAAVSWGDSTGVRKIALHVLETNSKAIRLYEQLGFEQEGLLRDDKRLSDGLYYNTVVMGRLAP